MCNATGLITLCVSFSFNWNCYFLLLLPKGSSLNIELHALNRTGEFTSFSDASHCFCLTLPT